MPSVDVRQPFKENNSVLEAAQIGIQKHLDHQQVEISFGRIGWVTCWYLTDRFSLGKVAAGSVGGGGCLSSISPAQVATYFQGISSKKCCNCLTSTSLGGYLSSCCVAVSFWGQDYCFHPQGLLGQFPHVIHVVSWPGNRLQGLLGWCSYIQLLLLQLGGKDNEYAGKEYILIFRIKTRSPEPLCL